jgi:hypothetical protein
MLVGSDDDMEESLDNRISVDEILVAVEVSGAGLEE